MASKTKRLTSLLPKLLLASSTNFNSTYLNSSWLPETINLQLSSPLTNKWVAVPKNFQGRISTTFTAITASKKMRWLTKWTLQVQDGTRTMLLLTNSWQLLRKSILEWRLSRGDWTRRRRIGKQTIEDFFHDFSLIFDFFNHYLLIKFGNTDCIVILKNFSSDHFFGSEISCSISSHVSLFWVVVEIIHLEWSH